LEVFSTMLHDETEGMMPFFRRYAGLVILFAAVGAPAVGIARDHIEIAGSSTIFPFTARVIQAVSTTGVSVVNNSTGSGGGIHAFCSGAGDEWPDITAASRAMSEDERQRCRQNGVEGITQLSIGYDGIVLANSAAAPRVDFTRRQLYLALAKEIPKEGAMVPNPHFSWNEIDPSLPPTTIEVLGPPSTSGTRDMFEQLAVKQGCGSEGNIAGMTPEKREGACTTIRQDGHYVALGEDDIEIVKRLKLFENAFGLFGYSYLLRYHDIVQANGIDGVLPTDETIEEGAYPLSRPLFLYVKNQRVPITPGIADFLMEYTSDKAIGDEGYLLDIGLVPLNSRQRTAVQAALLELLGP
jgi:phosphate transport system substrate-binding protein